MGTEISLRTKIHGFPLRSSPCLFGDAILGSTGLEEVAILLAFCMPTERLSTESYHCFAARRHEKNGTKFFGGYVACIDTSCFTKCAGPAEA